ncbi:oligosaccharide flippase family protein [Psychrobacter faecalis]|uniref:Oligosaccharide flippase family protein n=1 Tax=Psychrobacter faecalis TaxID=180588 RepID=A0ABT9HIT5_9GAMM|nr:oligosaccharide flippase family protein [Psychrobacter faecalis]MDP4545691.1 oligosaccharide flippase family protein [Psychrobacter faecalis]
MIRKIRTALQVEDIRQLMKNFFSLSVLKLVNAVLPFITLPYLIKVLGLQQYGAIVLALSLIAYFQSVTDYGFNLSATREIARHKSSRKQLSFIYSKTQASKLYLLLFSLSILIPAVMIVPQFREDLLVYLLMCLMLIGQTMFPEWFFRGVEQMGYITILDLIVKGSFTIGVFILIKSPEDYWLYPLLFGLGYVFIAILSHFLIVKKFKLSVQLVKKNSIIKNLKFGFPLFINQFMPNFYNNTTTFLIGMLLGKQAAGVFGAVRQLVNVLSVLNSVVSTVVFPYLVRRQDKFNLFSKFYMIGFSALAIILVILHKYILGWMGISDPLSSNIFLILVFGVTCIVFYSIYSTNFLIPRGYDKTVMKLTFIISLVGLLTSYPLITNLGVIGGAINIAFAQLLMGSSAFAMYKITSKKSLSLNLNKI